jgi:hypothetical protein
MNVLKKSALALAVAGMASAASAATLTPSLDKAYPDLNYWVLSNQGIEVGLSHTGAIAFDLKVVNAHESLSKFVLELPSTVDVSGLSLASSGNLTLIETGNSKYYVNVSTGTPADDLKNSTIAIRVGTGSFSVESYEFDSNTNKLTLISGVGQSLLPGSSIGVRLGTDDATVTEIQPVVKGAAELVVNTYTQFDDFIETGKMTLATTADQFALKLIQGNSELVDYVDPSYFAEEVFYNDDLVSAPEGSRQDVFELRRTTNHGEVGLTNDKDLVAKAYVQTLDLDLLGDFNFGTNIAGRDNFKFEEVTAAGVSPAQDVKVSSATGVAFELTSVISEAADSSTKFRFTFDNSANSIADLVNEFDVQAELVYGDAEVATKTAKEVDLTRTKFGEWISDRAIVNVPYMPIGYKATRGLDSVFEISNRGWADAEIKVKGFDQYGNTFGPVALLDDGKIEHDGYAKAQTVVKVSADDILKTFGLKDGAERKMNITFMIDANRKDIDVVPYYNDIGVRSPIMNSQYKDGAERR